jgi:hypothetical protein
VRVLRVCQGSGCLSVAWCAVSWLNTLWVAAVNARAAGEHPTTKLCLQRLMSTQLRGADVMDYGCGSGVLALGERVCADRQACARGSFKNLSSTGSTAAPARTPVHAPTQRPCCWVQRVQWAPIRIHWRCGQPQPTRG